MTTSAALPTILKTCARVWVRDLDESLPLPADITGAEPDLRLEFEAIGLAAIGDLLVIAGPEAEPAKYRQASATIVIDDLDAPVLSLSAHGAVVTTPEQAGPTGRFLYARHAGGAEVEYVERTPDLVRRIAR